MLMVIFAGHLRMKIEEDIMKNKIQNLVSPCGIYCGACPSFQKRTCYGCRSEDKTQKRVSKWHCKIRQCCLDRNKLDFCYQCDDFLCRLLIRLQRSHLGERKFAYREEIIDNLLRIKKIGVKKWLREQERKWRCPKCGGTIVFYLYKCLKYGHEL